MKAGFTGTSRGVSDEQKGELWFHLASLPIAELHLGDCIGGDKEAFELCRPLSIRTIIHPPLDHKMRAFCKGDVIHPPKTFLQRNYDIAFEARILFAAPFINEEQLRSGTWQTVRTARKLGKEVILLRR